MKKYEGEWIVVWVKGGFVSEKMRKRGGDDVLVMRVQGEGREWVGSDGFRVMWCVVVGLGGWRKKMSGFQVSP